MRMRTIAGVAALVIMLLPAQAAGQAGGQAAGAACWNAEEVQAAAVRDFQMMLMVAGLTCQAQGDAAPLDGYNRFVNHAQNLLSASARALQKRAIRLHGRQGMAAFDRDMTRIANSYANASRPAEYCRTAARLADEAAAVPLDAMHGYIGTDQTVVEPREPCARP